MKEAVLTQESVAHIALVLQPNKTFEGHGNYSLADYNSEMKHRAWYELFYYFGYDFLLSHHSRNSEASVRRKAEQIYEAKDRLLIRTRGTVR